MKPTDFVLNPRDYGVPTREDLVEHRIWDTHYHGFMGGRGGAGSGEAEALKFHYERMLAQHHAALWYSERMGIERVISLDIGGLDAQWGDRPVSPAAKERSEY